MVGKIQPGDFARIVFDDHSAGRELLRFAVVGLVLDVTASAYVLAQWYYADDHTIDDANTEGVTISRGSVISTHKLSEAVAP